MSRFIAASASGNTVNGQISPPARFRGGGQLSHGAQKPRDVDEAGLASVDTRPLVSVTLARDHIQELRQQRGTSA